MATQFPDDQSTSMVDRIKRLLMTPAQEWPRIDATPMTVKDIFTGWVVPLAAIGPIAGLIHGLVFGYGAFGITYRPSITGALGTAIVGYVLALIGTYVLALIIDGLAPSFGGQKNAVSAMKVAAFSSVAAWLAGVFQAIPWLGILGLAGIYSLYLLWIGLPILMKAPADRAMPYFAVTMVVAIIVFLVIGAIAGRITASMVGPSFVAGSGAVSGTVTVPGVGSVDMDKINEASRKMEAASAQMKAGGTAAIIPAASLQAMLPASIAGFTRGDTEATSGGAAGVGGSRAEATYTAGDKSFRLSVADAGAMGALATLGGALNVQSNKQTSTGYEKTEMVNGSMVNEKWDNQSSSGSFGTMVASRFMVSADGGAPSIDTLKQAVASIDTGKLAALAK